MILEINKNVLVEEAVYILEESIKGRVKSALKSADPFRNNLTKHIKRLRKYNKDTTGSSRVKSEKDGYTNKSITNVWPDQNTLPSKNGSLKPIGNSKGLKQATIKEKVENVLGRTTNDPQSFPGTILKTPNSLKKKNDEIDEKDRKRREESKKGKKGRF